MEVSNEGLDAVLKQHGVSAKTNNYSWIFSIQDASEDAEYSESLCYHVIGHLRAIKDFKETIKSEHLIVNPVDAGAGGANGASLQVDGVSAMSKYCADESTSLLQAGSHSWFARTIKESTDLVYFTSEFGVHVRSDVFDVKSEHPVPNDTWLSVSKHYRIERAFEYHSASATCIYRIKMVKEVGDSYISMKASNVSGQKMKYIYEIEWLDHEAPSAVIASHLMRMVQIIKNMAIPISKATADAVVKEYMDLTSGHIEKAKYGAKKKVLMPKPVTLEQKHLVTFKDDTPSPETYGVNTIWKNYCVTEKADGERMLLFVASDGKCYFINSDLDVRPAAFEAVKTLKSTLLDGEYVPSSIRRDKVARDLFAAFDIYFLRGEPVYRLPLVESNGRECRYNHLVTVCDKDNWNVKNDSLHELRHKVHHFAEGINMKDACKALLTNARGLPYDIDGLVFTPAHLSVCGYYPNTPVKIPTYMRWDLNLKWKPPHQNTIDFLVEEVTPPVRDRASGKVFRRFKLITGYDADQWEPINIEEGLRRRYQYVPKNGDAEAGENTRHIKREFQPLSYRENGVGVAFSEDCKCVDGGAFGSGMIVEFAYKVDRVDLPVSRRWVPLRVREDKTRTYKKDNNISGTANDFKVAMSIWRSIHKPTTAEMLTGATVVPQAVIPMSLDERLLSVDDVYYAREIPRHHMLSVHMLNFHNNGIKRKLYRYADKRDSLLELACGMAGDLGRWFDSEIPFVLGIDFVKDNICKANDGAYARMLHQKKSISKIEEGGVEKRIPLHYVFVVGDCSKPIQDQSCCYDPKSRDKPDPIYQQGKKLLRILYRKQPQVDAIYRRVNGLASRGFSMVSCQFAIHYFFETAIKLDGFLDNVASNLKSGGVFITTFMDGERVHDLLQQNNGLAEGRKLNGRIPVWAIVKRYDTFATNDTNVYGKRVDVFLENTAKLIPEFLVHTPTLIRKMDERGLTLEASELFSHNFNEILQNPEEATGDLYANVKALEKDEVQKQFSFLNRWMVFKKA